MSVAQPEGVCESCSRWLPLLDGLCIECAHDDEGDGDGGFPTLHEDAYYGLAGDFVRTLAPYTEANKAALLADFLATFGFYVGRRPFLYQGQNQRAKLFVATVGMSGKARKGATRRLSKSVFAPIDQQLCNERMVSANVGSGQGVIELLRDAQMDPKDETKILRGNIEQRLMLYIPELSGLLKVSDKQESILSEVVRQAWDDDVMRLVRREDPAMSSRHHMCLIGNITGSELFRTMGSKDVDNGLANRFLFVLSQRENVISRPIMPPVEMMQRLRRNISSALEECKSIEEVRWSDEAGAVWDKVYPTLTEDEDGPVGSLTARADTHPTRLAMHYALVDGCAFILPAHIKAGLALWKYCDESIRYAFDRWGGPMAALRGAEMALSRKAEMDTVKFLQVVEVGKEVTMTDLGNILGKHLSSEETQGLVLAWQQAGLVHIEKRAIPGRRGPRPLFLKRVK